MSKSVLAYRLKFPDASFQPLNLRFLRLVHSVELRQSHTDSSATGVYTHIFSKLYSLNYKHCGC